MRLDPGAEFSGFTIERTLGTGGMGVVYLARNPRLNQLVALKVLSELIASDTRGRARFEREAALAARLDHPNIVAIYDRAASDADLPWISMKYVGGGDVAQRMTERGGPLSDDHAVHILTDAARALDYAHRHGILHRDVKPGNILLDHDPAHPGTDRHRAVLTDFGIARALDDTLTLTGTAATFAYAAPERFHGATADHRADIYSLGCTFYELLTARRPFPRTDQAAVIAAHLNAPPPRPTDIRPELPPGINDVIAIALAKHPTDRYPTCAALAEAATHVLDRARRPHTGSGNPRTAPTLAAPPHPELIHTLPATSTPTSTPTGSADPDALTGIPESIRAALDSPHPEIRRGAVHALSSRLTSTDQPQAESARKALHHIALHDNPAVASYAREVLGGASTMDSPRLPGPRARNAPDLAAADSSGPAGRTEQGTSPAENRSGMLAGATTAVLGASRFEFRWPSGRFAITSAALSVSGCVLLSAALVLSAIIPPIPRTDYLWQLGSAAVLALAPAALSALHPRRLAIPLTIGCVAGESAISILLITQSVSIGDSAAEHWILALPVLFSVTLLALFVVAVAELVHTRTDRRSA
ncbi:serine/threonine-protein kinase [Nocardia sp. NPDC005825]|uniref:serine/threonine-protein kinase n=1 Tax=unclassified Nocardia TaxID=2637762 RepID=UPI00340C6448